MTEKKKTTGERWGIHVDGIKMPGFNSEEEANEYKKEKLKGKDAVVFPYHRKQEVTQKKDHYTPGQT